MPLPVSVTASRTYSPATASVCDAQKSASMTQLHVAMVSVPTSSMA